MCFMCSKITAGKQNLDKKLQFGIHFDFGHIHLYNLTSLLLDLLRPRGPSIPRYQENRSFLVVICDELFNQ